MTADLPATQSEATGRAHSDGDIVVLDGVIDRITYVNEENGYTVARLKVPRQKQLTTIAGFMPGSFQAVYNGTKGCDLRGTGRTTLSTAGS